MKIALDATYGIGKHLSGVGVYTHELLHGLLRHAPPPAVEWHWLYRPQHWRHALGLAKESNSPPGIQRGFLWERRAPSSCDLFHGLGQRLPQAFDHRGSSSRRPRLRTVATFHDLFVMTRQYSTPEFRARFTGQAQEAARRAEAIIAVSRFTAAQIEDLLKVEPGRIHVVPHGVRPLPLNTPAAPPIPREPIILCVGALQKRKNTLGLVKAFERMPAGWRLILTGSEGYGFAESIQPAIEASPRRASIELTGWVDDTALARLYARASVFAFPSLDEGFGIPVLEAMAAGVPVLASNTSSLPEVCGDAAVLINPESEEEIAAGLLQIMESTTRQEELRARGFRRAAEFTWDRCAQETWAVYRKLLG